MGAEHTFTMYSPARGAETISGGSPPNVNILPPSVCENGAEGCDGGRCGNCRYGTCGKCGADNLNCFCDEEVPGSAPSTFEGMFMALHHDCHEVMIERQKKYGKSNIPKFGVFGTVVRLSDKMERLINLAKSGRLDDGDFDDETLEDTLIDISNYANIARAQLRGWWTTTSCPPLEENLELG